MDQINFIAEKAKTTIEMPQVIGIWNQIQPQVEIPATGVSLSSLYQYIRKAIGRESIRVSGELILPTEQKDKIKLIVRTVGKKTERYEDDCKNINKILLQAAENIYLHIQPYILASYLYKIDKSEKKERCLAIIDYVLHEEPQHDDSLAYNLWGIILFKQRNYSDANKKFQKAIEEAVGEKHNLATAYHNWGISLSLQKKYEDAISKYKKAIQINDSYAEAYYNWGLTLTQQGKSQEAQILYLKASEIDPKYTDVYNSSFRIAKKKEKDQVVDKMGFRRPEDKNDEIKNTRVRPRDPLFANLG